MKHIPILFSTPMVQALLDGRKTMTRRVVKPQLNDSLYLSKDGNAEYNEGTFVKCPYGKVGDVLWVRERFIANADFMTRKEYPFFYYTDLKPYYTKSRLWKWKPSIHMPKSACRLFLEITNIRVERLQDITEEDAKAEGVLLHERGTHWLNYIDQRSKLTQFIYNLHSAWHSFRTLWQSINGHTSWNENPWVWVVEFKQVDRPTDFI